MTEVLKEREDQPLRQEKSNELLNGFVYVT